MAITNLTMAIDRAAEVRNLAWEMMDAGAVEGFEDALQQAHRQVDSLLAYAAQWDAQAEQPEPQTEPPAPQPEPVYVPSALEPHEQRAMDKALFMRASGLVPQVVGRFAFVPSRTTGGTVYRTALDGSSCTCEAGQHGRLCGTA